MFAVVDHPVVETVVIHDVNDEQLEAIKQYLYSEYGLDVTVRRLGWGRKGRRYELGSSTYISQSARNYLAQYHLVSAGSAVNDGSGRFGNWISQVAEAKTASSSILIRR